ncbi:MAG: DUF1491 family protein [Alphaproteobacteria bacterium]
MEPRLKAEIWVKAFIRRCAVSDVPAVVVRRGDETAGAVLVRVNRLDGHSAVYVQTRRGDGTAIWTRGTGPEDVPDERAEAYLAKALRVDPDVWIVEVEDREGRPFLDDVEEAG